jgi:GTP-sensing pleiotropic transcriptional regulator CodY
MTDERTDDGKFDQQYTRSSFLDAIESLSVASTQSVADRVGCSYDLAYRRLKKLESEGVISNEDVGGSFVWLRSEE